MNGILLIDKPKNWTSHDVVAKIRGEIKKQTGIKKIKVGHAGTLDPFATGLLIILVGSFTKRADEFLKLDKSYEFTAVLGKKSTTGDPEGRKIDISNKIPTDEEVNNVLNKCVGKITQIPPMYSAIKINGKRAYKIAREGNKVEMPSRQVSIYQLKKLSYDYPNLKCSCSVSSGTYIRTLAEDIGKSLDVGAYLAELKRTTVGEYKLSNAFDIEDINLLNRLIY